MKKTAQLVCFPLTLLALLAGCATSIQPMLDHEAPVPDWRIQGKWEFTFRNGPVPKISTFGREAKSTRVKKAMQAWNDRFIAPYDGREERKVVFECEKVRMNHGLYKLWICRTNGMRDEKPDYYLRIGKVGERHVAQICMNIGSTQLDAITGNRGFLPVYAYAFVEKIDYDSYKFTLFDFPSSVETVEASGIRFSPASPDELKKIVSDANIRLHPESRVVRRLEW